MAVKIKIREIEMTPEEAREVYRELKVFFGEQEAAPYIPYVPVSPSVPQYPWYEPIITC